MVSRRDKKCKCHPKLPECFKYANDLVVCNKHITYEDTTIVSKEDFRKYLLEKAGFSSESELDDFLLQKTGCKTREELEQQCKEQKIKDSES